MSLPRKNLHVPLSVDLYEQLRREARRSGRPATRVAQEAIERLLEARRREETARAIADYARKAAGSKDDLDPTLERASIECLQEPRRKTRRGRR